MSNNVDLLNISGVTYFKLTERYEGDITKNYGLTGAEIDNNFHFLRGSDIKGGSWDADTHTLTLYKLDNSVITISGIDFEYHIDTSGTTYDKENGILTLNLNGKKTILTGFSICDKEDIYEKIEILSATTESIKCDINLLQNGIDSINNIIDEKIFIEKGETNLIYKLFVNDEERGIIDIPSGMIIKRAYMKGNVLVIVIETQEGGEQEFEIDMSQFVKLYKAGDGLKETRQLSGETIFSIRLDNNSQEYLKVTNDGLAIYGIDEKFDELSGATQEEIARAKKAEEELEEKIKTAGKIQDVKLNGKSVVSGDTAYILIKFENFATTADTRDLEIKLSGETIERITADKELEKKIKTAGKIQDVKVNNKSVVSGDTAYIEIKYEDFATTADTKALETALSDETIERIAADEELEKKIKKSGKIQDVLLNNKSVVSGDTAYINIDFDKYATTADTQTLQNELTTETNERIAEDENINEKINIINSEIGDWTGYTQSSSITENIIDIYDKISKVKGGNITTNTPENIETIYSATTNTTYINFLGIKGIYNNEKEI